MRTTRLAVAAIALALFGLTACTSAPEPQLPTAQESTTPDGTKPESTKPESTESTEPKPSGLAFTQCMRDNGIDLPDPDPDTGLPKLEGDQVDPSNPTFQKAMKACESLQPEGGVRGEGEVGPEELDKFQAYAECMRENGLPDFPDPQPGGEGGMFGSGNVDRTSPTFQKANDKCGDLLAGVTGD